MELSAMPLDRTDTGREAALSRPPCLARHLTSALAVFAACAALLGGLTPVAQAQPAPLAAGDHTLKIEHAGQPRTVIVHVPAALSAGRPLPLVLALHGGGGSAEFMASDARYGLSRTAEREGFVVAYPNGFSRFPGGRFATWNAGGCCGPARDTGSDDVGFLREVVARLSQRLPIDARRVFATGMSNGGMMSHRLACDAADVFRAVAAVAGTDATAACQPVRPVAVLNIHALDDDHVRYEGGAGVSAARDRSQIMDYVSVPQTVSRWVQRNRCSAPPRVVLEAPGARCERTEGCADGVSVMLCTTEDGGHGWPGTRGTRPGQREPSQALDANSVIWRFFAETSVR